jgi:hypothetical protein
MAVIDGNDRVRNSENLCPLRVGPIVSFGLLEQDPVWREENTEESSKRDQTLKVHCASPQAASRVAQRVALGMGDEGLSGELGDFAMPQVPENGMSGEVRVAFG